MPKVETIIQQLAKNSLTTLPEISQVFQSDPERIIEALQAKGKQQSYYIFLKILHSQILKRLRPQEPSQFFKLLLQISPNELMGNLKTEALLYICEGIIDAQDHYRTAIIDKYLADLSKLPLNMIQLARLERVSAGNNFLKKEYAKAAAQYLSSSRMEAFVKDQNTKIALIEKAIAFAFISSIGAESHKVICSLCMNQTAKKSKLFPLLSKLYRQDIFTQQQISSIATHLPTIIKEKDREGVSILEQSAFSRNMIPIFNSFSTIKLQTLLRLSGVNSDELLLILLQKTYKCGEVSIDQVHNLVRINNQTNPSEAVKQFLTQIDSLLQQ